MAADSKRVRNDESINDDSSSDGDADEDISLMDVGNGDEIQMDFEGFGLTDDDFDGVRQLMVQLFTNSCPINISSLTNYLLSQNFIGTVLKQSELQDGETDEVYALTSCVSLTRPVNEVTSSLQKLLLAKCKSSRTSSENKTTFSELLTKNTCVQDYDKQPSCIAYVINERFINVPSQACVPMFEKLSSEIEEASKKGHRARYDFTHYIMICKVIKNMGPDTLYLNPEEEFFFEEASMSFDFDVVNEDVCKTRRVLLLTADAMAKTVTKLHQCL